MTKLLRHGAGVTVLALAVGACSHSAPPAPPPPEVGVINVQATNLPMTRSYPGRLAATLIAQVPARVTGNILKRVYKEGTDVKVGQVLFQIDPAPLLASLRQAQGQLAQAVATAHDAELNAQRSKALGAKGLLAKQAVDDAIATAEENKAAVKAAQANVENAKINLGYATVTSPISGRAGIANYTQGALVQPTDTTPLTTVQVIDPIYANFSEPMAEVEHLRKQEKAGGLKLAAPAKVQVQVVLPDGSTYPHTGTLDFTDIAVDPSTGAVNLRAVVPNPDHTLLPGMFVKIRIILGTLHNAFLLPQSAILRDSDSAYVLVVDTGGKVVKKQVNLGDQDGADWIVTGGLAGGDRVIASGVQKVQAGEQVRAVPFSTSTGSVPAATVSD
ncbi:MAG: efflux RND transporter periplasmic adaptor subunit [Rhodanobacteraceae bacterium]